MPDQTSLAYLDNFIKSRGIRFFSAHEVVQLGRTADDGSTITMPDKDIWWHIIPTLKFLDEIRDTVGPIRALSGYRPLPYNRAEGSSDGSLHVQFNAIDWRPYKFADWRVEDLLTITNQVTHDGQWHGTAAYHDRHPEDAYKAGFIHLDTRGLIGDWPTPARWGGLTG